MQLGEYAQADACFRESLLLCQELGEKGVMARALEGQAMVFGAQGDVKGAAQLWGTAAALRDHLGVPIAPSSRAQQEREQRRVREHMEAMDWSSAWHKGQEMQLEHAVAAVLNRELFKN